MIITRASIFTTHITPWQFLIHIAAFIFGTSQNGIESRKPILLVRLIIGDPLKVERRKFGILLLPTLHPQMSEESSPGNSVGRLPGLGAPRYAVAVLHMRPIYS